MKIAVTGGTGFIGQAIVRYYLDRGADVVLISRSSKLESERKRVSRHSWQQIEEDPSPLEKLDALIHLAGETINKRWSEQAKHRIMNSRVETTRQLVEAFSRLQHPPEVAITSSAVGFYGTSLTEQFDEYDESLAAADDFLSNVTKEWEAESRKIPAGRSIQLRTGVVLDRHGGALPKMALPYQLFAGGRIGTGRQWLSWIHLQDIVRLVHFCMDNPALSGPVNATAPAPVTNDEFGRILGSVLRRPHYFPIPASVFRIMLGEMSTLLLDGQKVLPNKALEHGFEFQYPSLREALVNIYHENG